MKKIMICMLALFLCTFAGCGYSNGLSKETVSTLVQKNSEKTKESDTSDGTHTTIDTTETTAEANKRIVFTDGEEKTKEVAKEIEQKIQAVVVDFEKLEEDELEQLIRGAELILIGMQGTENVSFHQMDRLFSLQALEAKRVSLFYIGEENSLASWEETVSQYTEICFTPGFYLSWEENMREEELNRMNGWLTTAFTYEQCTKK